MEEIEELYEKEFMEEVLPFWMNNSIDREYGGFLTCLLADGEIYDTDKFVWLQARQIWTFATVAVNKIGTVDCQKTCLEYAEHGASFLLKYGRNTDGNWYFSLDRKGSPLIAAYNIFSDCFACMGFSELYNASGNDEYKQIAISTFYSILERKNDPKGQYNKSISSTRNLQNFSLPMILCNLCLVMGHLLDKELVDQLIDDCVNTVMIDFYNEDYDLIVENINADGSFSNSFDGRLINPGHAIEAMWFVMDIARKNDDSRLLNDCIDRLLRMLEYGWDDEYGGITYYKDIKGFPMQQLEWDQKLWWVHVETLVGLYKAYQYTEREDVKSWFDSVHSYTWEHFRDEINGGEWYGYLKRDGTRLNELKGGKWKGCFHVPRGMMILGGILK